MALYYFKFDDPNQSKREADMHEKEIHAEKKLI